MLYDELYEIWKNEKVSENEIQLLPNDFYSRIAIYIKKMKEENRMLDRKTGHLLSFKKRCVCYASISRIYCHTSTSWSYNLRCLLLNILGQNLVMCIRILY